jgi:TonB family protein
MENTAATQREESDVSQLAAKFAAHGGGKIPAELSGELALDIVLNEVVEQAWLTTGATGSAIALVRGGEMVCRASGGVNAPELGMRLDTNSGLSGACVRTRQIQCCDDALADPRADAEASRQLGMRSVVVLPLLLDAELIGIFEIFSPRACAFGDHDLQTLEVLAERILRNARARRSSPVSIGLASHSFVPATTEQSGEEKSSSQSEEEDKYPPEMEARSESATVRVPAYDSAIVRDEIETPEATVEAPPRFDWLTTLMGGIIVGVALLMAMVFAMRVGWLKQSVQRRPSRAASAAAASSPLAPPAAKRTSASAGSQVQPSMTPGSAASKTATGQAGSRTENPRVQEGSLRVYENGKEIFRMSPSDVATAGKATEKSTNANSVLQPAGIVELAPDAVEGSLVHRVEPQYPEQALAQKVQGPVVLDAHIGSDGVVKEIKVVSGDSLLVQAAIAAVKQWRFKPQTVDGRAVDMQTQITLKFTLPPS